MDGQRIFDGMHLQAAHARLLPVMQTGTGPVSSCNAFPTFNIPAIRGVHESPFTYLEIVQIVKKRGETPPKMIVTNMGNDYYSLRASLARTGSSGTRDAPIPDNVRIYDVAGGAHAIVPFPGCKNIRGTLNWYPVMRFALVQMEKWLKDEASPINAFRFKSTTRIMLII
jgi:hypothetical protein